MKFAKYKQVSVPSFFQHFAWTWMRLFMVVFCRVKINGSDNFKGLKTNVIIASNHSNEFDPIFIVAALPFTSHILPLSFVSRSKDFYAQMSRGSLYGGKFFELMGAYPVYPGLKDYRSSLRNHLHAIECGRSVAIFPLGKRHTMTEIDKARGGVSYLAHKTGLPVVPMRIDGIDGKFSLGRCLTFKYRLSITFGQPLYSKDIFEKGLIDSAAETHKVCEKAAIVVMQKIADL